MRLISIDAFLLSLSVAVTEHRRVADERVPSSSSTGEYSSDSEFTFNETEEIEMLAMEIRKNGQSRTPWQRTLFTLSREAGAPRSFRRAPASRDGWGAALSH